MTTTAVAIGRAGDWLRRAVCLAAVLIACGAANPNHSGLLPISYVPYDNQRLHADHPVNWTAYPLHVDFDQGVQPAVAFSSDPISPPCLRTDHSASCNLLTLTRLSMNGAIVLLQVGAPSPADQFPLNGQQRTIEGKKVVTSVVKPGICQSESADETILGRRDFPGYAVHITACGRGPDLTRFEEATDHLMASIEVRQ